MCTSTKASTKECTVGECHIHLRPRAAESWIRVAVIVIFNELFEAVIRGTSTSVCYKDESTQLVRHFKRLTGDVKGRNARKNGP